MSSRIINALPPGASRPEARSGPAPRIFVQDNEIADPVATFEACRLTPEPAIEISGASGVTLILALASGQNWRGHAPGPNGLPGGYPVKLEGRSMVLDLPKGVTEAEAFAWNDAFEQANGLTVSGTTAQFNGRLSELLAAETFSHAEGFDVRDLETVCTEMLSLRTKLQSEPA